MTKEVDPCENCPLQGEFRERLSTNNLLRTFAMNDAQFAMGITPNNYDATVTDPDAVTFANSYKTLEKRFESYDVDDHYVITSMRLLKERCSGFKQPRKFGKKVVECASTIATDYISKHPRDEK